MSGYDERTKKLMALAIKAAGARDEDDVDGYIKNNQLEVLIASNGREFVYYSGIEYSDGCDVAVDVKTGKVIVNQEVIWDLLFSDVKPEYSEAEIKLLKKAIRAGHGEMDVQKHIDNKTVSITEGNDGRKYAFFMGLSSDKGKDAAVDCETGEVITEVKDIYNLFFAKGKE